MLLTSDVDPDPELVGQVGSGPGIFIALNPVLTFSTTKSVFLKIFYIFVRFVFVTYQFFFNLKNYVKVCQQSCHEPLSQFVSWPGLNVKRVGSGSRLNHYGSSTLLLTGCAGRLTAGWPSGDL